MRVIIFQPRFVPQIEAGSKRSTIRDHARCQPGDNLSLRTWRGAPYRSKQREMRMELCKAVKPVKMFFYEGGAFETFLGDDPSGLGPASELALAKQEGFTCIREMRNWFISHKSLREGGPPYTGELIEW